MPSFFLLGALPMVKDASSNGEAEDLHKSEVSSWSTAVVVIQIQSESFRWFVWRLGQIKTVRHAVGSAIPVIERG